MLGDLDEARHTAADPNQSRYGSRYGIAWANLAWAQILKGNHHEALGILNEIKPRGPDDPDYSPALRAQLVGVVFTEWIRRGNFAEAENLIGLIPSPAEWNTWTTGVRYRVEAFRMLAEALAGAGRRADAYRVLGYARRFLEEVRLSPTLQGPRREVFEHFFERRGRPMRRGAVPTLLVERLEEIAATQTKLGDAEGARLTRALLPPAQLGPWLDVALSVSQWTRATVDQKIAAARKSEAGYVPTNLAKVARDMGIGLLKIRTLERKSAGPVAGEQR